MRTSRVEREYAPLVVLLPSLGERIRMGRVEEGCFFGLNARRRERRANG